MSQATRLAIDWVEQGLVPDAVFVSARTGEGVEELKRRVAAALPVPDREVTAVIPYDRGELVAGEDFEGRSGRGRQLVRRFPFLAEHRDLNRANAGITVVVF